MNLTDGTVRAQAGYTYDTAGRVATVGDGGDTLTYAYAPGTGRVASTAWTTATGNNTAYTYDSYHRLTAIAVNNTSVYGYTLNDKNQRTAATLENGDNWAYTYDTLGQLTGALKKDSQDNTLNSMSYAFDLIGNRTSAVEDATNWTYASNLLNQYTQVNALLPTYDADGNMLTWNGWTYTWNGENRLVTAENTATGIRLEAEYDFMGRRIFKKVYANNTLTEHRKFAYNGYKLIAEFDALNSNALLANYLWQPVGLDVPLRATIDGDASYFVADGNKNIIALKDASGATTDDYTYTPFGAVTTSGATDNPFRFSSEYHDAETDLVYYNFRYYNPTLGRWVKRDSIGENGGMNLYGFAKNSTVMVIDTLGLSLFGEMVHPSIDDIEDIPSVMRANDMIIGAELMDKWFSLGDDNKKIYVTNIVTMAWAKKFTRFKMAYDDILKNKLYINHAAQKRIVALAKKYNAYNTGGPFGTVNGNVILLDSDYVQTRPVGAKTDPLDDMYAALGRFNLKVLVEGKVIASNSRRSFCIDRIGLYIRDSYDFVGAQPLGYWDIKNKKVFKQPFLGGDIVTNGDFREYRDRTGYGHDFIIFSDIEVIDLEQQERFNE